MPESAEISKDYGCCDPRLPLASKTAESFVNALLSCSSVADAYTMTINPDARGARQSGHRLLKKPEVQARFAYLQSQKQKVQAMSKEIWLAELVTIAKDKTKSEVSRLKAYEMYGKAQGYYSDNSQTQVNIVSAEALKVLKDRLNAARKEREGRKYQSLGKTLDSQALSDNP